LAQALASFSSLNPTVMKTILSILLSFILMVNFGLGQSSSTIAQFEGQPISTHSIFLEWKTMMEMKIAYYTVQRSDDGIDFQDLANVDSKMTDSTNVYQLEYTYTDQSSLPGTSYYRLKVVDDKGLTNYSDVIRVSNDQVQGIKIYPTVVQNNSLFVETDKTIKSARLEIFDLSGKKISETDWSTLSGRQNLQAANNVYALVSGTYVARLSGNGETLLSQILIIQSR